MLLQSTSQLHSGHFCFLLNICLQKIWTMLHHEHHSGHFCVLLNIYWKTMDFASINFIPVIFTFSWIFFDNKYERCFIEHHSGHFCILLNISWEQIWMYLQSTSFWSYLPFPEYFLTKNTDNAIPVIFAFSWIFSDNKLWMLFQSTSFRSFLLSPEYFLTTNMDDASLSFIQVIFAVWIFLIDIASIKFIFAFSWIFHEKNVVHSSHKQ